jgi:hypothetical protein
LAGLCSINEVFFYQTSENGGIFYKSGGKKKMRPKTKKIMGITLAGLSIAGYMLSFAEAQITTHEKLDKILQKPSEHYLLVGFILLHWEYIIDMVYIYGFRTLLVVCFTYQNGNMTQINVLGPGRYFDFGEYHCTGHIGQFVINAVVTKQ